MSENEEDLGADWGDAMEEQATAEAESGVDENEDEAAADWGDALQEQSDAEDVEAATFDELETQAETDPTVSSSTPEDIKLDVILDVPVTVSMEIGRTSINIRNLLQLNQGSVIELDRFAGEPMDVLVNGTLIAHGEVVVVNDKFGIRLTDVISPSERVKKLGS
ncbi:MAG: flagellar motor switch protein FliN [Methylococcaceae bacterium]|nr:flagellar motor switch protein FliN [Methylococcaceae bacterium]